MGLLHLSTWTLCLIISIKVSQGDLCADPVSDLSSAKNNIVDSLKVGVTPLGGADAGTYSKIASATTLLMCLSSCCDSPDCNVLFFTENTCFLIACNTTWVDGCKPRHSTLPKFKDAFMLSVRSIEETRGLLVTTPSPGRRESAPPDEWGEYGDEVVGECVEDGLGGPPTCLGDHEECRFVTESMGGGMVGYGCVCRPGYQRHPQLKKCARHHRSQNSSSVTTHTTHSAPSPTTTLSPSLTPSPIFPSASTSLARVETLIVSAGENKEIRLPLNEITLFAFVLSEGEKNQSSKVEYSYHWSLADHPAGEETGDMENINSASVKLSKLRAGLYTFKVVVTAQNKYGEALVNVSVLPPVRLNKPPVAIVKPVNQEINQLNDVIIDGSGSTDDDKIVRYHWEQVRSPITNKIDESDLERMILVLKHLVPGSYTFKLTVTDSDGETDSAIANVTVIQDVDYPPQANAGSNVIISLPQNSVTLYGNASTDDKGSIASYEWMLKNDNKLSADMQGVTSPFLKLDNLQVGDYTFELKVTDSAGQSSVASVSVFVKPENNQPPVANAGPDHTVYLPGDKIILDGRNSTDDQKISSYHWSLINGPSEVLIKDPDSAVSTVSGLVLGVYKFQLQVKDNEGLLGTSTLTITVKQNENKPPVANAGGSVTVTLPMSVVKINGSLSTDDKRIVSYLWSRDKTSPAAGDVVAGTDRKPVLELVNVVTGRYMFRLNVTDAEGLTASDTMTLIVKHDKVQNSIVELFLATDIQDFKQEEKNNLIETLSLLLVNGSVKPNIIIDKISTDVSTGQTYITFYAETIQSSGEKQVHEYLSAVSVASVLRRKLRGDSDLLHVPVNRIETLVCQSNCSGHGSCDHTTKRCVCDGFWMEDFIKAYFTDQETNCDWSVLYVIIVVFTSVLILSFLITGLVCACRRCSRMKHKVKKHRYALLDKIDEDFDDDDHDRKHNNSSKHNGRTDGLLRARQSEKSSLMASDSEFSSEETIFINTKKLSNGNSKLLPNGVVKPIPRAKVAA